MGKLIDDTQDELVARLVAHLWFYCGMESGTDRIICLSRGQAEDNRTALYAWVRSELEHMGNLSLPELRCRLESRLRRRLALWDQHPERSAANSRQAANFQVDQGRPVPPRRLD
jgi:hypothetical protein